MKVDWDELKRLHEAKRTDILAGIAFQELWTAAFPAILAEREAAQEFRDVVAGLAVCDAPLINQALATFDKESKNEVSR